MRDGPRHAVLTAQEERVRHFIVEGQTYKQIAGHLGISVDTVRRHASRVKQKTELINTSALACIDMPFESMAVALQALPAIELTEVLCTAELAVLAWSCQGMSAKEIALRRGVSPRTVEKQKHNAMAKIGARSVRELAAMVRRQYANGGTACQAPQT